MEKPVAALLRENQMLRDVAEKAIRLRRIGMQTDELDDVMQRFYDDNPHITRSATQAMMLEQAFKTAMSDFDQAVLTAAESGMDWAANHGIAKPTAVATAQPTPAVME